MTMETEKQLCESLVEIMNDMNGLLKAAGDETIRFKGVQKIKNIAKNQDPNGLRKLPRYLEGLQTVMSDEKILTTPLRRKLEQAYSLVVSLEEVLDSQK